MSHPVRPSAGQILLLLLLLLQMKRTGGQWSVRRSEKKDEEDEDELLTFDLQVGTVFDREADRLFLTEEELSSCRWLSEL